MRIEICGGIGSGKTTLSSILKKENVSRVSENFKLNPFWEPFYSNPNKFSFETEITFLLQHYHQIKINKNEVVICDFSLYQDLAFAKMGLKGKRLQIFEDVFHECINEIGAPDFIIHLECSPDNLLSRIRNRGRKEELLIDKLFLTALNDHIANEIVHLTSKQKLVIDSSTTNFATDPATKEQVTKMAFQFIAGHS